MLSIIMQCSLDDRSMDLSIMKHLSFFSQIISYLVHWNSMKTSVTEITDDNLTSTWHRLMRIDIFLQYPELPKSTSSHSNSKD